MSRFLFVVPPLAGHVNPAAAVAQRLTERGHDVAWAGSQARLGALLGPDANIYPTGMRLHRGRLDTGLAAIKSLWEGFVVPFARFILPAVDQAIDDYRPDVVAADQHAIAGAIAAERRGLPWATLATSPIEFAEPFGSLPKVQAWISGQVAALAASAGLADAAVDLRYSPYLVLAFTVRALFPAQAFGAQFTFVGSALARRPEPGFPWEWLDPGRRHVIITVGTLAEDVAADSAHFYSRAVEALRPLADRVQGIVVAPPGVVTDPPAHILVAPRVPLLGLMPQLDAVICHGGMGTVSEALSYGVPLIIAPIRHDQPITAARVAQAGAGLRVKFGRVTPEQLRDAVVQVLDDPAYRAGAEALRDCFASAGGAAVAADALAKLA